MRLLLTIKVRNMRGVGGQEGEGEEAASEASLELNFPQQNKLFATLTQDPKPWLREMLMVEMKVVFLHRHICYLPSISKRRVFFPE